MDGINFQGMTRIALTPAEEALIPRPPSSASQVATALPNTYTRFGSSHSLASPPASSSCTHTRSPQSPPPSRHSSTAPTSPLATHEQEYPQNPQDSYHSHTGSPLSSHRRGSHSQDTPLHQAHQHSWGSSVLINSPMPMTDSNDSDDEGEEEDDDGEFSRETDSSKEPTPRHRPRSSPPQPRRMSVDLLRRLKQSTTKLAFNKNGEGSLPSPTSPTTPNSPTGSSSRSLTLFSEDSYVHHNTPLSHNTHPHTHHHHIHRLQYRRTPNEPELSSRHESPRSLLEISAAAGKQSRECSEEERVSFANTPLQHPEPRRVRSAWRPSLSLIRQESSIHGQYPSIHGQYPQHDSLQQGDTTKTTKHVQSTLAEDSLSRHRSALPNVRSKKDKRKRKQSKHSKKISSKHSTKPERLQPLSAKDKLDEDQSKIVLAMPNLQQVLDKKTSFPLGYDDFEAFLRTQRAAEYLNFWADVTAHEQLCRTFEVSERRQVRELQLEERAIARDKRRLAQISLSHADCHVPGRTQQRQDMNSSNPYLTSRSSLQLPLADHLSFPIENRRYGHQDSTSLHSPPMRRQTFDHQSSGAYNKLLSGVSDDAHGRRSSFDTSRTSLDRTSASATRHPLSHHGSGHFGHSSTTSPHSYSQMMRTRGSTDILAGVNTRAPDALPPAGDTAAGLWRSNSNQQFSSEPHPNTLDEIAKLAQAVEESIQLSLGSNADSPTSEPPMGILDTSLFNDPPLSKFDQSVGPLEAPLVIRRSVDGAHTQHPATQPTVPPEAKTLLVQSYRTIGLEDVQESALQIYRKFLIQLRTASMAAEEAATAAAVAASKEPTSLLGIPRPSVDGLTVPRWDGYAELVIAEWNEKWRGHDPETRRLHRLSGRKSETDRRDSRITHSDNNSDNNGDASKESRDLEKNQDLTGSGSMHGFNDEENAAREEAMAKRRSGSGFTAFLNRLLRTETTILELPTLTINTTTVEEEAVASDRSEDSGDEEEDYDSDIDDDDEEDDEDDAETDVKVSRTAPSDQEKGLAFATMETCDHTTAEQKTVSILEDDDAELTAGNNVLEPGKVTSPERLSAWDHISIKEVEHEGGQKPRPAGITGSHRRSSFKQKDQTRGIRSKTGKVASIASKTSSSSYKNTQGRRRSTSVSSLDTIRAFPPFALSLPKASGTAEPLSLLASLRDIGGGGGQLIGLKKHIQENGKQDRERDLEKGIVDQVPLQMQNSSSVPPPVSPTFRNSNYSSSPTPSSSASPLHPPQLSSSETKPARNNPMAHVTPTSTAFYLPLECRQRIHRQVLEENRTDAPHLFGPAKGFVVEVVLRDHYYPLFLEHVKHQNLGLSSRTHVYNQVKRQSMLGIGIGLWCVFVAAQVTLIVLEGDHGGWSSPWVWLVGVVGGWTGSICLATGILCFSPILGLTGKIAEDKHVWRFRKIADGSIRILHFRRSMWMLSYCLFWTIIVTVIFAAFA